MTTMCAVAVHCCSLLAALPPLLYVHTIVLLAVYTDEWMYEKRHDVVIYC